MANKIIQNFGTSSNRVACSQAILCCVVFTSSSPQPKSNTIGEVPGPDRCFFSFILLNLLLPRPFSVFLSLVH